MEVTQGYSYHIKDEFFDMVQDKSGYTGILTVWQCDSYVALFFFLYWEYPPKTE